MPPNIRPPFPPNVLPPNGSKHMRQQAPNVFSAPPSLISKPPQTSMPSNPPPVQAKPSITFEAKPQIRYFYLKILFFFYLNVFYFLEHVKMLQNLFQLHSKFGEVLMLQVVPV